MNPLENLDQKQAKAALNYEAFKTIEILHDKIDGLEADLEDAVRVAYNRGATEWCRLNYPKLFERFEAERNVNP